VSAAMRIIPCNTDVNRARDNADNPARCPFIALTGWTRLAAITDGTPFRPVGKDNQDAGRGLHPESVNTLVQKAFTRAGIDPGPYSAHNLRAGFVTYAHLRPPTRSQRPRHRPPDPPPDPWPPSAPTSASSRPGPIAPPQPSASSHGHSLMQFRQHTADGRFHAASPGVVRRPVGRR
jgi:hypothetical protein